jgi:hypothetical protein
VFPRFYCDACSKPIEDEEALTFWDESGNVAHAHEGACAHKFFKSTAWVYSDALVTFLANLVHNTGINPKTLKPDARCAARRCGEPEKLNRGVK